MQTTKINPYPTTTASGIMRLFDLDPPTAIEAAEAADPALTADEAFEAFHAANPGVADDLAKIAFEYLAQGFPSLSPNYLVATFRMHGERATNSTDGYRINNNHGARYARLLKERHPELADMLRTRRLKTDGR